MNKTYRIYASTTDYLSTDIEAQSYDHAWYIAHDLNGGVFQRYDFTWDIDRVELLNAPKPKVDNPTPDAPFPDSRLIVLPRSDESGLRILGQTRPANCEGDFNWNTESEWHMYIPDLQKLLDKLPLVN